MNQNRRKLLKILAIGGGVGLFAKFFGTSTIDLITGRNEDAIDPGNLNNFKIKESGEGMTVYSKDGEELFVIDNGS